MEKNLLMGRLGISYGALEYLCITEGTLGDAQILEGWQFRLMTVNGLSGHLAHNRRWWPLTKTSKLTSNWWKWQWCGGWLLIAIICVIVAEPRGCLYVGCVGAAGRRGARGLEKQTAGGFNCCLWALEQMWIQVRGTNPGWLEVPLLHPYKPVPGFGGNFCKMTSNFIQLPANVTFLHKFCAAYTEFMLWRRASSA